ncbi:MAG: hypothetical protein RLZZ46_1326 [Bacteroidota bacterium]|jgi:hypothetical protein
MQEFLLTLVVFFVLFRIIGEFSSRRVDIHVHKHEYRKKSEGEITVTQNPANSKPSSSQQGEYTDYEEVKD